MQNVIIEKKISPFHSNITWNLIYMKVILNKEFGNFLDHLPTPKPSNPKEKSKLIGLKNGSTHPCWDKVPNATGFFLEGIPDIEFIELSGS